MSVTPEQIAAHYFNKGRCSGHNQFNGRYCRDVAGPERWCIHCAGYMLLDALGEKDKEIARLTEEVRVKATAEGRWGPTVKGRCPSCGHATLFVGSGGYLTCSWLECKSPGAPTELLADPRAANDAARAEIERLKGAICSAACQEARDAGRGPCGACVLCVRDAQAALTAERQKVAAFFEWLQNRADAAWAADIEAVEMAREAIDKAKELGLTAETPKETSR